ncbi:MAG: hypothetical protein RL642_1288 [Bacteroidota bacterium]
MMSELRKFYLFLSAFLAIGIVWVSWNYFCFHQAKPGLQICVLKNTVGLACPSCGTTRSVLHLMQGDVSNAMLMNPLGILVFLGLIVCPFWIVFDWLSSKRTLWSYYLELIRYLQNKKFSIVVILLVLINWFWNIQKGI